MGVDVMGYIKWAMEEPSRRVVKAEINHGEMTVWAYDSVLGVGMHPVINGRVIPADEIDLIAIKNSDEKKHYERLKKKFEGGLINEL